MAMDPSKEGTTKEPYIDDPGPLKLDSIRFSNLSNADMLQAAEPVQVYNGLYYDDRGKPIANGLLDPRMGPLTKLSTCATCHGNFTTCPGHYGYFPLALPVYNVGYMHTIVHILKCICKSCARVLLPENVRVEYLNKMRSPRMEPLKKTEMFKKIVKMCNAMTSSTNTAKCSRCGFVNGTVKNATGGLDISHGNPRIIANDGFAAAISHTIEARASINHSILRPDSVLSLFKRMLDEDSELLYLCERPENLLFSSILVPPLAIRPSVFVDGGTQSYESPITQRLQRIIEANATLHQELLDATAASICLVKWADLQAEVARYINSDALSGLSQRIKGGTSLFRGKTVEYTGRSVISPDPNLKITEVGIPITMAQTLTYPEKVTEQNIEKLRMCVRNGPYNYRGAKSISDSEGALWLLASSSNRIHLADDLKLGMLVNRHLEDGDVILLNKQPSLHRMSVMCHRAKIKQGNTISFNTSMCNPYNANFDGDAMNIHVPQTEEARAEALLLMGVQNNICTPKSGEILVSPTQDILTSSFLITRKDTFYERAAFSLICCYMGDGMDFIDLPTPALIKPIKLWTGKQIFDVLLRPHSGGKSFVKTVKEKGYVETNDPNSRETLSPSDTFVYIHNSELISGALGKTSLGNGDKDSLLYAILNHYGSHGLAVFMLRLTKLSARWIGDHGFSIGIDDVQSGADLPKCCFDKYIEVLETYNKGQLRPQPGFDIAQTLEARSIDALNSTAKEAASACLEKLHWRNSLLIMSQSGSSGSPSNISQMIACLGQQTVGGKRASHGFTDRSLPHFPTKSNQPAAKGFVANSFYSGLSPTEFFFHCMEEREGLAYTAVKTTDTGYISRRLIKALEDLSLQYDYTVRDASACIVQFVYGDDGSDPSFLNDEVSLSRRMEPGTPVGAIAAQSVGESGTRMILGRLHRMKEILNASKTIGSPIITAELDYDQNFYLGRMVKCRLEKTTLGEVAQSVEIILSASDGYILITLDVQMMHDLLLDAEIVKQAILLSTSLKVQHITIVDGNVEVRPPYDSTKYIFDLHALLKKLPEVVVKGIRTVKRAILNKLEKNGRDHYSILVEGTGLLAVMGTEGVDGCKTSTNHIMEIAEVIGIEAARECILEQLRYMSVDSRHLMLLADWMTFKGEVLGIGRYGLQKMKDSVWMLASFEKTTDRFFNASANGRDDKIEGVSECIIMGKPMKLGTGMFKVQQRVDNFPQLSYGPGPNRIR